ncbi:homeodomain-interacting protein kinase 4 [Bombina bombina]|uniref:homeodomain-interacting protein kinase 4 n=1 Tax=Bombina bombina TaxID=8345 RepID=UPI00235A95AC|nr:homeodomain-interacting protein kinase 4 [Bombina bombina]
MEILQSQTDYYYIKDYLGRGTFGEVAKSWKISTGEHVAIKMLKNNPSKKGQILNEIKMLNALRDVDSEKYHIIRFYEFFYDYSKVYLVFELLQQSLYDYQEKNNFSPLPVRHIRTITTQVLIALAKLKEMSIIHTDLKPENIMLVDQVNYPFRIKLIDFGSASLLKEVRHIKKPYAQTRPYRSPEILLGLPFCEKMDMWSLGCIIAELHLGWILYPGGHEYDQIRYICETQGMPKSQMLSEGRKTFNFFKKTLYKQKESMWELKSKEEYWLETKIKPLETRTWILKSLDQLKLLNAPPTSFYSDIEALAEYNDRSNMIDLLKRMLTWDSKERITPRSAMIHPYISLLEMKIKFDNTKYFLSSLQSLQSMIRKKQNKQIIIKQGNDNLHNLLGHH